MVTEEEELPYGHLKHEVVLAEAEADVCNSSVEEAGGSEHQDQVEVPGEGGLDNRKESCFYVFLIYTQEDPEFKITNTAVF